MAISLDLHPEDERELFRIRRELIGWHHATETTQQAMSAKLGRGGGFIYELEKGDKKPRLSVLQEWASCFDLRVEPEVLVDVRGVVPPEVYDEEQMLYALSRPFDAAKWVRLWTVANLTLQRHNAGLAPEDIAERLGLTVSSIHSWERTAHDPLVVKLFTYARGIGGRIVFHLIERQDWRG